MAKVNAEIDTSKPGLVGAEEEGYLVDQGDRRKSPTRLQEAEVVDRDPEPGSQLPLRQVATFPELC